MTELKRWVFEYSGQIQGVGLHKPPLLDNRGGSLPGFLLAQHQSMLYFTARFAASTAH